MNTPKQYMQRCLELAHRGLGAAAPNPMVGCVIVADGRIIGEGWHRQYGGPHAEVNAINSVRDEDRKLLSESTVYVSLEPCAHFGKTPPCADLLVREQVKSVVIACRDPFPRVDGRGIEKLEAAGIEVEIGLLEAESLHLNRRFVTSLRENRPYFLLKWAESADGFIGKSGEAVRISNELTRRYAHRWRTEEAAILVGEQTVLSDNPSLTARNWPGQQPLRIAFQKYQDFPVDLKLFDRDAPTLLLTSRKDQAVPKWVEKVVLPQTTTDFIPTLIDELNQRNLQSVLIEGGWAVLQSFIDAGLWDEARVFRSPNYLGSGVAAPKLSAQPVERRNLSGDELVVFQNRKTT